MSAIFIYPPAVFTVVKYLGAAYLVWLGSQMLFSGGATEKTAIHLRTVSHSRLYWQGIMTEILNPKTALFFLSFLPQFVVPVQGSAALQMMVLGCIFLLVALATDLCIAMTGGVVSRSLLSRPVLRKFQHWCA